MDAFDVVIVGAGPAGAVAALGVRLGVPQRRRGGQRGRRRARRAGRPHPPAARGGGRCRAAGVPAATGDAAGLVNPLSGEGIATALLSGMLAGTCAVRHGERAGRAYAALLERRLGAHLRRADLVAGVLANRALVGSTIRAAGRSPRVLAELAELSVGTGVLRLSTAARVGVRHLAGRLAGRAWS